MSTTLRFESLTSPPSWTRLSPRVQSTVLGPGGRSRLISKASVPLGGHSEAGDVPTTPKRKENPLPTFRAQRQVSPLLSPVTTSVTLRSHTRQNVRTGRPGTFSVSDGRPEIPTLIPVYGSPVSRHQRTGRLKVRETQSKPKTLDGTLECLFMPEVVRRPGQWDPLRSTLPRMMRGTDQGRWSHGHR